MGVVEIWLAKDWIACSFMRSRVCEWMFGWVGRIGWRSRARIVVLGWIRYASTNAAPRPLAAPVTRIVGIVDDDCLG